MTMKAYGLSHVPRIRLANSRHIYWFTCSTLFLRHSAIECLIERPRLTGYLELINALRCFANIAEDFQ